MANAVTFNHKGYRFSRTDLDTDRENSNRGNMKTTRNSQKLKHTHIKLAVDLI